MKVIDASGLAAPRLLPFELGSIARSKMRRRPDAVGILVAQLRDGLGLPVTLIDVDFEQVTLDKKLAAAAAKGTLGTSRD